MNYQILPNTFILASESCRYVPTLQGHQQGHRSQFPILCTTMLINKVFHRVSPHDFFCRITSNLIPTFQEEFQQNYFMRLEQRLGDDYQQGLQIFPPKELIFNAPMDKVSFK